MTTYEFRLKHSLDTATEVPTCLTDLFYYHYYITTWREMDGINPFHLSFIVFDSLLFLFLFSWDFEVDGGITALLTMISVLIPSSARVTIGGFISGEKVSTLILRVDQTWCLAGRGRVGLHGQGLGGFACWYTPLKWFVLCTIDCSCVCFFFFFLIWSVCAVCVLYPLLFVWSYRDWI